MKRFIVTLLIASIAGAASAKEKVVAEKTDIVVGNTTLVQRCVLKGAKSSRMIAVGEPDGFNYAFDAMNCAPVSVWFGAFLDFAGETNGRGGNGCKALGIQQPLGIESAPLRTGDPAELPSSLHFHGYRRDPKTGAPTFLFEMNGVSVEQQITSKASGTVEMNFRFPAKNAEKKLYRIDPTPHLRIALGDGLRWSGPGVIEIPAEQATARFTIHLKTTGKAFVREVEQMSGADIFRNYCSACHSTDGTKLIGPSFKGLWGREEDVTRNGISQKLTVDTDYVRESILKPQAAIVKGYEAVPMADFSAVLTKEQIESLITFLRGLE